MAKIPGKKKKELPPIMKKPDNPKRLYMTKKEAIEDSKQFQEAKLASIKAFEEKMKASGHGKDPAIAKAEANVIRDKQLVKVCNDKLNKANKELKDAETNAEKKQAQKLIEKAQIALDNAQVKLAKTEDELEILQKS